MSPETADLVKELVRHARGVLASVEKWVAKLERKPPLAEPEQKEARPS